MAVIYRIEDEIIYLVDPFYGLLRLSLYYFVNSWYTDMKNEKGIVIILKPGSGYTNRHSRKMQHSKDITLKPLDKKHWGEYICEMKE